jgi:general secretion pathway protein J
VSPTERGFTVVELLVAMTVLGLVMVLIMQGMSYATTTRERMLARSDAVQAEVLARELLGREVARAQPVTWRERDQTRPGFVGTADRLRLATVTPPYYGGAAWRLWEFRLEPLPGERRQLVVRRAPLDQRAPGFAPLDRAAGRVLLVIEAPVQFQYYGRVGEDRPAAWLDRWGETGRLPQTLRLVDPSGRGAWPELLAAPRVELPALCASGAEEEGTECPP